MMLIGYARVSTADQSADLQVDALLRAGVDCRHLYTDQVSGARADRPELAKALADARDGDTFVVWRLDRLGRSLSHLIETVARLQERGVGFRSLTESIDTTTPGGKLVFHMFGALAQFEREINRERTMAGLQAAAERGRRGGRPKAMDDTKVEAARRLIQGGMPARDVAASIGVGLTTLYRYGITQFSGR